LIKKKIIKKILPNTLINFRKKYRIFKIRKSNINKDIKDVFKEIYLTNLWGGKKGTFFSGSGSDDKYTQLYAHEIKEFIKANGVKSVIDLGCGDFRVGRKIVSEDIFYTGVDIVDDLINNNNNLYGNSNVKFLCNNILKDRLPDADLCLVRQVLQHLSNEEIVLVLENIKKYRFIIVTEHYPSDKIKNIVINKDKVHGPDTRIYDDSAVYLNHPPFNLVIKKKLLEINIDDYLVMEGEKIISFLL
jgi:SAM-dependent methyltransferase